MLLLQAPTAEIGCEAGALQKDTEAPSREAAAHKSTSVETVRTFHLVKKSRGWKKGFRKTTPAEDRCILRAFYKVRQPLESLVESRDVWNELTPAVRSKVCLRIVRNRLRDKGYAMEE